MDPVLALCILAIGAVVALPVSIFAVLYTTQKQNARLLTHLEAVQVHGGVPVTIVKQQHQMQFDMDAKRVELERQRLDEMRRAVAEGMAPEAVLGS